MSDQYTNLLDTADRIAVADLYPARLRTVISDLSAALRETSALLTESRDYGSALVEELRARTEKLDKLLLLANSMDADFESYTKVHPAVQPDVRIKEYEEAYQYALHLAESLRKNYPPNPDFQFLGDLVGLLTQIDNMVAGLDRIEALQASNLRLSGAFLRLSGALYDMTAERDRLQVALTRLLEPFEEDPCYYDHHGYCQAHFVESDCCVAYGRGVLKGETT